MISAAIPLKRLTEAKSRLAPALDDGQRQALALAMVRRVVRAVRASGAVQRVALVTPDTEVAERLGVEALPDRGDLNRSLQGAVTWAKDSAALLLLPADLPLVSAEDIRALAAAPGVVLARTQDGGTGALLLRPPNAVPPHFGPDSFAVHRRLAERRGLTVTHLTAPGLSYDLDTVADLEALGAPHP